MKQVAFLISIILGLTGGYALAEPLRLAAPPAIVETGLLKYMLPRFSLKTQVRVDVVGPADSADLTLVTDGSATAGAAMVAVLERIDGEIYFAATDPAPDKQVQRLLDWLTSDIGKRTISSFKRGDTALFQPPAAPVVIETLAPPDGDEVLGERVALRACGRCHVVSDANKFSGIGSTPSFGALRALPGWEGRFEVFWTLNPHPSFTQIEGITEPFDPERPPSIAPVILTMEEVDGIFAFVTAMPPKDLGPPLAYQ